MHDKFHENPACRPRRSGFGGRSRWRRHGAYWTGPQHQDTTSTLDWLDRTGENDFYVAKRKPRRYSGTA